MKTTLGKNKISIRPTTSVYATYRRLSYKAWYALAEFIDNSTQSFFENVRKASTVLNHLTIQISYSPSDNILIIEDDAFGMEIDDFTRALMLDRPPQDRSGRSEFGMGLKTAACWFGGKWRVETTQLNSNRILIATINVERLAVTHEEEITYDILPTSPDTHYTKIIIEDVHQPIRGRTVTKVREHLSSIYRDDIRSGAVSILWNGTPLIFEEPPIFEETDKNNSIITWKKEVGFSVPWERTGTELTVNGWIGIRKHGKQMDAGLVLFRRGRVIIGGPDQGYKPSEVFGQANSFRSQRLIGELHMDQWPVTQSKDDFDWSDGLEEAFIEELVKECKEYGDKAEIIRLQSEIKPITKNEIESVFGKTVKVFEKEEFGAWVSSELNSHNIENSNPEDTSTTANPNSKPEGLNFVDSDIQKKESGTSEQKDIDIGRDSPASREDNDGPIIYKLKLDMKIWIFKLFWQSNRINEHWMGISYPQEDEIDVFLNMGHQFIAPYLQNRNNLELIQKFVIALALAEKITRISSADRDGRVDPADFRIMMNRLLKRVSELEAED